MPFPYYTVNATCPVCPSPCCSSPPVKKAGTKTTDIYQNFDSQTVSTHVNRTQGCGQIPLKSGGSLSLARYQLSGQTPSAVSVGPNTDKWQPAGASGVFDFLPFLINGSGKFGNQYAMYSAGGVRMYRQIGATTYYSPDAPEPSRAFISGTQFTEVNFNTGLVRVFGASGNALAGRILQRTDRNNNTINYLYSANGGKTVLRKLTGDLGNVVPYFGYLSETGGAPITTVTLLDKNDSANNRTISFQYDASLLLTKVIFPAGCTTTYRNFSWSGGIAIQREVDQDGNTTYFEYTSSVANTLSRTIEPSTRRTYYSYPVHGRTGLGLLGRTQTYYAYASFSNGSALTTAKVDALGNVTYYRYTTNNLKSRQIDPNGNVSYYEYDTADMVLTRQVNAFNGASTYYKYQPNNQDVFKMIGPRHVAGSFPVVTYYNYDSNRNLISTTDALGNNTATAYDAVGRVVRVLDARLNATYFVYDSVTGRRSVQVDANNQATYFGYNSFTDQTRAVSPRWREVGSYPSFTTYYEYDARDQRTKTIDALGQVTTYDYTNRGDLLDIVDPRGVTWGNGYSALRLLTKQAVTDASAIVVQKTYFGYDIYKNRISQLDPRGNTSTYSYDALDRQTGGVDPIGQATYFGYDSVGNRTKVRDARSNTTYFGFDQLSRPTSIRDPLGNITYFGYDLASNRRKWQDPRLNTTYYAFDALNRMKSIVDANIGTWSRVFDANGNVSRYVDAAAHAIYFAYDALNRNSVIVDQLGNFSYYFYDASGNRTKGRNKIPATTYFFYDAIDRLKGVRDALGQATYYFYDKVGNPTIIRNARGNSSYFTYDALSRLVGRRDALADLTYFGYDPIGNIVKVRNGVALTTTKRFDAVSRLTSVTDPLGNSAYFAYDRTGNRVKERDQDQNTTYFAYDAINRLTAVTDPLNITSRYSYDAGSNLHGTFDNNGQSIYFAYDSLSRKIGVVYASPVAESQYFAYDAVGNLIQGRTPAAKLTFRYDALNRMTRKTLFSQNVSRSIYFTYTSAGANQNLMQTIVYPQSGATVYFKYDAANGLKQVNAGITANYVRNALSRVQKKQLGNLTVCYYGYDNAERLISIRHFTRTGQGIAYFDYQRDASDRITRILRENTSIYYTYDGSDRLTSEVWLNKGTSAQIYAFRYTYDAAGNRLRNYRERSIGGMIETSYYKYDAANALVKRFIIPSNATSYYRYDANGSLVKIFDGANATYFTYGANQLISNIVPPAADGLPWEFAYDAQLSRRRITKAGVATYYIWNGMNPIEEHTATQFTGRFFHGEPIVPGVGSFVGLQRVKGTQSYFQYLHMDHQGNAAKVTDQQGNIQFAYTYDAFGRQIGATTGLQTSMQNDFIFATNWFTITVGTKRYGLSPTRIYDFDLGRFLQRDPLPTFNHIFNNNGGNRYGIYGGTPLSRYLGFDKKYPLQNAYNNNFAPNNSDPSGAALCCIVSAKLYPKLPYDPLEGHFFVGSVCECDDLHGTIAENLAPCYHSQINVQTGEGGNSIDIGVGLGGQNGAYSPPLPDPIGAPGMPGIPTGLPNGSAPSQMGIFVSLTISW